MDKHLRIVAHPEKGEMETRPPKIELYIMVCILYTSNLKHNSDLTKGKAIINYNMCFRSTLLEINNKTRILQCVTLVFR